tara:strand:- start:726 stop:3026 length:2301 start_codon:yes stop_codon:yes gene_type:complete
MATFLVGGLGLYMLGSNYNNNSIENVSNEEEKKRRKTKKIENKKKELEKEIIQLKKQNKYLNKTTHTNTNITKNYNNIYNNLGNNELDKKINNINFLENDNLFQANSSNSKNELDSLFNIDSVTDKFQHNNMVHFFGSKCTQNIDTSQQRTLDLFTGQNTLKAPKKEKINELPNNKEHIHGGENNIGFYKTRYNQSKYVSNELPFEQIKVGPGLGVDTEEPATGNFHPDIRQYELPKTVDELRAANNPRVTYKGKIVQGKKEILRDSEYHFTKYKKSPMFVNKPLEKGRSYIPASFNKNKPLIQTSNNRKVSGEVKGPASKIVKNVPKHINMQDNKKQILCSDNVRNVNVIENKFDYDKDNYCCEETKRESQAPLQFKKEHHVRNFLEALIPTQHYSDKSRQTIKETTENNSKDILNLKGQNNQQYYNNQPARQTIKETTENNSKDILNFKGGANHQVYNNQPARQTIKETTENNIKDILNVKVYSKLPSNIKDKIKKTLKQTILHTPRLGNVLLNTQKICDVDNNKLDELRNSLKTTLKEMLIKDAELLNFVGSKKQMEYLNDVAKTTHKETYADHEHIGIGNRNLSDGYKIVEFHVKTTNKQDTTDNEYVGIGNKEDQSGYLSNKYDAKETNKETYVDNEHYGSTKGDIKMMSYEDIYNATINDVKEETLVNREPTQNNAKTCIGPESINVEIKTDLLKGEPDALRISKITNSIPTTDTDVFNKVSSNSVHMDDLKDYNEARNIIDVKQQLDNNPLNIDITDTI